NMFPLEYPKYDLNRTEMQYYSMQVLKEKRNKIRSKTNSRANLRVNNIFVVGDFFFVDVSVKNKTNIPYSIEDFKFSIQDKKIYKATNNQSINIEPIYKLYSDTEIKRRYRNVFVFRKFTFPNKRYFNIFVVGDFFFVDVSVKNKTNIPYSIEDFKFSIQDKKIYKATNNQSINIEPIYKLYSDTEIKRRYRNVFVFRKFTFPNKRYFN